MTEKTVSFKMPKDEVDELDKEAADDDKSRSAYIRSLIRSRNIKEQFEEQVLTKEDQRQYEQQIQQLKKERDRYRVKAEKADAVDSTIEKTVSKSMVAVRQSYKERIEQLEIENKQLRDAINEQPEDMLTQSDLDDLAEEIDEIVKDRTKDTREQLSVGWGKVNGHTKQRSDEIIKEVRRSRSVPIRILDWFIMLGRWLLSLIPGRQN
jgi:seryl-tRNA synthetase